MAPLVALALLGCNAPPGEPTDATSGKESPGQNAGGIAPMGSGAAGGLTPVQGSDSVTGAGGGGVHQAAKDQARRAAGAAGSPSGSSVETAPAEESGD